MSNYKRDAEARLQMCLPWAKNATMSTSDVANVLDCSTFTVRCMCEAGDLAYYQMRPVPRSPYRVFRDSVIAVLARIDESVKDFDLEAISRAAKTARADKAREQSKKP